MAYDSAHGQVVLFGGVGAGNVGLNDTWVWDGTNWTQKMPSNAPSARALAAMANNVVAGQILLFGGLTADQTTFFNDTWVWDGTNWTPHSTPPQLSARVSAMAFGSDDQVVLFGGANNSTAFNDTWLWNGSNWTLQSPGTIPTARYEHAMAYDSAHNQVVMFSGYSASNALLTETWLWH
jgi:hypothetical protein